MKTILLMTDFSENAKNAIQYTINLFGENVEYILLNTYTVRENSGAFISIADKIMEISKKELQKELETIYTKFPKYSNLKITQRLIRGGTITGINTLKNTSNIDLIVMGTKGASGLTKLLIGSVTASVVKSVDLPVLIVPEKANYSQLKKIVFATDLPKINNKDLITPLIKIAQNQHAQLLLLGVVNDNKIIENAVTQNMKVIQENFSSAKIKSNINIVEGEDISEVIEKYCAENNVDLLTVVAHHNKFFDRLFHKSISQELVFHAKLPILVLDDSFNK